MKTEHKAGKFSLVCEKDWLNLECQLPLRALARGLALAAAAAITVWGSPELVRFAQLLLGSR